jgi:hypothetical protein
LVDTESRYWKAREQAAFANRATETAKQYLQEVAKAKDDADTESLVREIRGDFDTSVFPDKRVRAFIIEEALESPEFHRIFQERASNRKAYEGLRRHLRREFAKMANARPDPNLTEDREAVAAAVRGASTTELPNRHHRTSARCRMLSTGNLSANNTDSIPAFDVLAPMPPG